MSDSDNPTEHGAWLFSARSDFPPFHIMLGVLSPIAVPLLLLLAVLMRVGLLIERLAKWAVAAT